ncbi:extracellular solute-binding protein [Rodentibacter heidelbergensis]|uniref:Potassium transporter Trk n=1 Tax=Rodentibacter heidelbergensis TaxID=1908258 RepID=A0A1V3ICJ8_9PAST|nr:extracellular solute-binding protein [Rodentibacter heidelbergensis]OOF37819.1 potassium transporter Trk [Rodentibacter heidelbergensis]
MKKTVKLLAISTACSALFAGNVFAQDLSQKSWAEIEEQAKKEGQVVVSIWYLQPQFRAFVKQFEEEYGIKVRIPEGTNEGNVNKLIAEKNLEKGKMDVVAIGGDVFPTVQKAGVIEKINYLPNFEQGNHFLQGVALGDEGIGYWGNQTGLAYDPQRISEDQLPQTWEDVQKYLDSHPKKFAYADPNGGGSGKAFIERALHYISGEYDYQHQAFNPEQVKNWGKTWDWFVENKDKMTRTSSNADSLTRLNDGELDLVAAWQDHLFSMQKQGAVTSRLKFYVPKFGMPAGGNLFVVAKNSKNPAASLVFINWIVSPEIQQKLSENFGSRPLNKDTGKADILFFPVGWSKPAMASFTREVIAK